MNPLRALVAALVPDADEHAARTHAIAASLKAMRADVKALLRDVTAIAGRVDAVSREVAQVRRLQDGRRDAPAMLDELAALMATDRVAPHLRAAVERAPRFADPVPRLAIDALWPGDVYRALADAIPDPIFFDGVATGTQTLRVPPRLAPVAAVAIWTFVAEMVDDVVLPAVAARFTDLLDGPLDVTPGRLVRRPVGSGAPPSTAKEWQRGHLVIDLAGLDSPGANTAAVVFAPVADGTPIAAAAGVRHTYEVWFGAQPAGAP